MTQPQKTSSTSAVVFDSQISITCVQKMLLQNTLYYFLLIGS